MDVQRNFESNVEKRTKDTFGPPSGKRLVVFIDDLNMPKVDTYGTQQPIALLKLLLEKGGMYDRGKDLNWKKYQDMIFVAAMGKVSSIVLVGFFCSLAIVSSRVVDEMTSIRDSSRCSTSTTSPSPRKNPSFSSTIPFSKDICNRSIKKCKKWHRFSLE